MSITKNTSDLKTMKTFATTLKKQNDFSVIFDQYQLQGARQSYGYAFAYGHFSSDNFYPIYDMYPTGQYDGEDAYQMFYGFNAKEPALNLKERLEECGVVLNTCNANSVQQMYYTANVTEVPAIDLSNCTKNRWTTQQFVSLAPNLKTVEKIIVSPQTFFSYYTFYQASNIEHMPVEGTIAGGTSLDLRSLKKLNRASLETWVNALSEEVAPYTAYFSLTSVNKAFETTSGENDGSTSTDWLNLIAPKQDCGWTIILGEV